MDIKIVKSDQPKQKPQAGSELGFGHIFSDYMFVMEYNGEKGWHNARIQPYQYFSISPAATVLHYAQEVFEGLKAYKTAEGGINLFRSKDNFARMSQSAQRLAMPAFDEAAVNEALMELVRLEKDWIPSEDGTSLYIRPNYMGVDPFVGVRAANNYLFYIICGPVGAYYKNGLAPTRILVEEHYTRAAKGGMGYSKTGGNYAASLIAGEEAHEKNCDQVLWLDAEYRKYVEEVGSMNIMFVIDGKIVTPPLDGTILPGITRNSVLALAREKGIEVEERKITIEEVLDSARSGALTEAFGTGTAAVVSPVGEFSYKDEIISVAGGNMGEMAITFYKMLTDIQYGRTADTHGWVTKL